MPFTRDQGTQQSTSWGPVASWYDEHLQGNDTYHAQVILPYLLRYFSSVKVGSKILEIGCGQGFFARALAAKGFAVSASDISPELIATAKKSPQPSGFPIVWQVADAAFQKNIPSRSMDVALAVLTLQNMRDMAAVLREVSRVLTEGGRFIFVLNHPSFRIPKASSWGFDGTLHTQYRRVDAYMTEHAIAIDMQPGKKVGKHAETVSFHRPLSLFVNQLTKNGFAVTKLDELISHRTSVGSRATAENISRKEFPLFMTIEATKL
jgi:ubiquinone/menaquinone biosynthesis C-methylase UbiE